MPFLPPDLAETVGWALVHSTWIVLLFAGIFRFGTALLANSPASLRHGLGMGCLLLSVLAPIGLATWQPAEPDARMSVSTSLPASEQPAGTSRVDRSALPGPPEGFLQRSERALDAALPWLARVWAVCVAALLLRLAGGLALGQRWSRTGVSPLPDDWNGRLVELGRRLGVARGVRALVSRRLDIPCVVGLLKPVVLVPTAAFHHLTPEQLEAILLHELAHVRRWDPLLRLVQAVAETLLFFHPAARWMSERIETEREFACDDLVVAATRAPKTYATALASLEGSRPATAAVGATDGNLLARIRRLVEPRPERGRDTIPGGVALAAGLALILGLAAFAGPSSTPPETSAGSDPPPFHLLEKVVGVNLQILRIAPDIVLELPLAVELSGEKRSATWATVDRESLVGELERLRAARGSGAVEVLAAPRLHVLDGTSGSIRSGISPSSVLDVEIAPTIAGNRVAVDLEWTLGTDVPRADRARVRSSIPPSQVLVGVLPPAVDSGDRPLVLLASFQRQSLPSPARYGEASDWAGAPISMSLVGADLVEFFEVFEHLSGREIVLDPEVDGEVTVELQDVPSDEAFHQILQIHCLVAEEEVDGDEEPRLRIRPAAEGDSVCSSDLLPVPSKGS